MVIFGLSRSAESQEVNKPGNIVMWATAPVPLWDQTRVDSSLTVEILSQIKQSGAPSMLCLVLYDGLK